MGLTSLKGSRVQGAFAASANVFLTAGEHQELSLAQWLASKERTPMSQRRQGEWRGGGGGSSPDTQAVPHPVMHICTERTRESPLNSK